MVRLDGRYSSEIYKKLREELDNPPGEEVHFEMYPIKGSKSRRSPQTSDYKLSAVLILLYEFEQQLNCILTERQTYKGGKHSGQISFPGGKTEPYDRDTVETAIRETEEEIGINRKSVQLIGELTEVFIPVSNFLVHPYIGCLDNKPSLIIDEREVKSVIHFPLSELLDDSNKIKTKIQMENGILLKDIPAFQIQNKIVWGATSLILNELKSILRRF